MVDLFSSSSVQDAFFSNFYWVDGSTFVAPISCVMTKLSEVSLEWPVTTIWVWVCMWLLSSLTKVSPVWFAGSKINNNNNNKIFALLELFIRCYKLLVSEQWKFCRKSNSNAKSEFYGMFLFPSTAESTQT